MRPDFSEFSYGYAVTEALIGQNSRPLRAAPIFPSLQAEGAPGGGYDVNLPFAGFPLFLQFKLSSCMVRRSAYEVQHGVLEPPLYRVHIRPTRHSQQHPMLLALEQKGFAVFYVAPVFHEAAELNSAYLAGNILDRSYFFPPSMIGDLPDDDDHSISFRPGWPVYFFSEPVKVSDRLNNDGFWDALLQGKKRFRTVEGSVDSVEELARDILETVETAGYRSLVRRKQREGGDFAESRVPELLSSVRKERDALGISFDALRSKPPGQQVAYISRSYLDTEIIQIQATQSAL